MTQAMTIKPHLERRFADHRLVFWHDPQGQYASDLDSLDLPEVTTVRVANDEYAIKHLMLHDKPDDKFLIYRSRSEEHTSELQSPRNLVCRLLL